jgi:hypothetical protein
MVAHRIGIHAHAQRAMTITKLTTRAERRAMQPTYDTSIEEPHPDDADDVGIPDREYRPLDGETMADVLRRVGGIELAAKRMIQALNAKTPNNMPDYRSRLDAAKQLRDTIEGTPDKKPSPPKKDKDGAPSPGSLITGKGKA